MSYQSQLANKRQGTGMEEYRASERNAEHTPGEWFDLMDNWDPVEVKSTQRELSTGRAGRFRLWHNQHSKMTEQAGEYDFIVLEGDDDADDDHKEIAGERTLTASEVSDLIDRHNLSWTGAGGHDMGRQVKIPWHYVVELDGD